MADRVSFGTVSLFKSSLTSLIPSGKLPEISGRRTEHLSCPSGPPPIPEAPALSGETDSLLGSGHGLGLLGEGVLGISI